LNHEPSILELIVFFFVGSGEVNSSMVGVERIRVRVYPLEILVEVGIVRAISIEGPKHFLL
jgi:hypothetical protein